MKLLLDMNLSPRWVDFLTEAGFEGVHWFTIGASTRRTPKLWPMLAHDYVVLTHDLDFGSILAVTHGEKPSVVQVRSQDVRTESIGFLVVNAIRQMVLELEQGALLTMIPSEHASVFCRSIKRQTRDEVMICVQHSPPRRHYIQQHRKIVRHAPRQHKHVPKCMEVAQPVVWRRRRSPACTPARPR